MSNIVESNVPSKKDVMESMPSMKNPMTNNSMGVNSG